MDRYQRRHHGPVGDVGESGQSTVEFAVVTAAFMAVVAGLAALWHAASDGTFSVHALMAASHSVDLTLPGGIADILLY
ncbi:hypothetical protein [Xiamenia xianingshaonis]|uniref:TadE-like protein n=1 Tax=Xiamenia xianingshaonis TaxID=2682776 RepID=A0A9E6MPD4_9ACTN|nr:hypothetical protein [Xiamenia xianingshaonis]NGM17209.1 hypothetical protein [Eggerthellaceae bacterium zg-893]NHM14042.1 hypothetical protein [Xiamenia xianingshaonis]QTU83913.1 hypothetical protein J7S26_05940 [Xiamenia xianingshaonis]